MLHALAMLVAGGNDIDPRGVDTAVTENVRELGDVLFHAVKRPCKQVPKIVRKDLVRVDMRLCTKAFHLPPDVCPADGFAVTSNKDRPCCDMLFFGILQQLFLEAFHNKNRADLSLAADSRFTAFDRFNCDEK